MNTENEQDSGEETQIYLLNGGQEFWRRRRETYYRKQFYLGNKNDLSHLWVFQKAEIALAEAVRENFSFWKNSGSTRTNSKPFDYLYLLYG